MKQYDFIDINKTSKKHEVLQTEIDGINLDDEINGFQTLSVSGRELVGRDIESRNFTNITAGKKSHISRQFKKPFLKNQLISSQLQNRYITIKYKVTAKNDYEFRRIFEKLSYLINKEEVKLIFSDDEEYYYIGTIAGVEEVAPDSNEIISSFSFNCLDPYKYSNLKKKIEFSNETVIKNTFLYSPLLENIKITIKATAENFRLYNETASSYIQINKILQENSVIDIDMKNLTVKENGEDIIKYVLLYSDLEEFNIDYNDNIKTNSACDVVISYTERIL